MTPIQFYAVVGVGFVAWSGVMHWTGRLAAAENCEADKVEAAAKAVEAKNDDDAAQSDAATQSDAHLMRQIAALSRKLENSYVPTGLACDGPGSGDSVLDAHADLFEAGLPTGRGGDGAGDATD